MTMFLGPCLCPKRVFDGEEFGYDQSTCQHYNQGVTDPVNVVVEETQTSSKHPLISQEGHDWGQDPEQS